MAAMKTNYPICVDVAFPNGEELTVEADPWTTSHQLASTVLRHKWGIRNKNDILFIIEAYFDGHTSWNKIKKVILVNYMKLNIILRRRTKRLRLN